MVRRFIIAAVLMLCAVVAFSGTLSAQDTTDNAVGDLGDDFYRNTYFGAGLHASFLSGAGLAGRVSFPGGITVQGAFFVMTVGEYLHANVGSEVHYSFYRSNQERFYGLLGAGFYSSTSDDSTKPGNRIANPFRIGLGLGYEWFISRSAVIYTSGAITYFTNTAEVYPLPEIGLFFYFR